MVPSLVPEPLDQKAWPEDKHIASIARLPLAPCYSVFALNTGASQCFHDYARHESKLLGILLRFTAEAEDRKELLRFY